MHDSLNHCFGVWSARRSECLYHTTFVQKSTSHPKTSLVVMLKNIPMPLLNPSVLLRAASRAAVLNRSV